MVNAIRNPGRTRHSQPRSKRDDCFVERTIVRKSWGNLSQPTTTHRRGTEGPTGLVVVTVLLCRFLHSDASSPSSSGLARSAFPALRCCASELRMRVSTRCSIVIDWLPIVHPFTALLRQFLGIKLARPTNPHVHVSSTFANTSCYGKRNSGFSSHKFNSNHPVKANAIILNQTLAGSSVNPAIKVQFIVLWRWRTFDSSYHYSPLW